MNKLYSILIICMALGSWKCEKIPERKPFQVTLVKVDGDTAFNYNGIEMNYNSQLDLTFAIEANPSIKFAKFEYFDALNRTIVELNSNDEEILPKEGSNPSEFTFTVLPKDYFAPPIGNPVVDRKILRTRWMSTEEVFNELNISILLK